MPNNTFTEFLLYTTPDGQVKVDIFLKDETIWLPQKRIAELFGVGVPAISKHLDSIFESGELQKESTVSILEIVRQEGKRQVKRNVEFYNLDAIISVGYRVNSKRATKFRIWATERLKEYIIKGFAMDDERLKNPTRIFGEDYFDEVLERIRDIRSSEKRFYQKIRDIYKLAVDYDPKAEETLEFFRIVQNKLHFAISGKTAAELIYERADASKPNMGLTSWKGAVVRKGDVTIAKNYLNQEELEFLNRIVTMYLDFAEDQAKRRRQIFMREWRNKLDAFLTLNERDILQNAGQVSKAVADKLATQRYEIYNKNRLTQEAKQEALEDDKELARLESRIEDRKKEQ